MPTFSCRNCGDTDSFQVYEMTPRHRSINVVSGAKGEPLEGDDPGDGSDETFYEASEFRAYRCDNCGEEKRTLAELVEVR